MEHMVHVDNYHNHMPDCKDPSHGTISILICICLINGSLEGGYGWIPPESQNLEYHHVEVKIYLHEVHV